MPRTIIISYIHIFFKVIKIKNGAEENGVMICARVEYYLIIVVHKLIKN